MNEHRIRERFHRDLGQHPMPRDWERRLTARLPAQPAPAVPKGMPFVAAVLVMVVVAVLGAPRLAPSLVGHPGGIIWYPAPAPTPTPAAGQIANPSFETGTLSGWSCSGELGRATTSPVHSGVYALAGAANDSDNAKCSQTVAVTPGTAYTLSAYVEGRYVFLGVEHTGTSDANNWTPDTGGGYQQLSVGFTTGANTTSVTIYVHGWYAQGTYYADDFSLVTAHRPGA